MNTVPSGKPCPLNWKCSQCGSNAMVEVSEQCRATTRIIGTNKDGKLLFGEHTMIETGRPTHYECDACGSKVYDGQTIVRSRNALLELLKKAQ